MALYSAAGTGHGAVLKDFPAWHLRGDYLSLSGWVRMDVGLTSGTIFQNTGMSARVLSTGELEYAPLWSGTDPVFTSGAGSWLDDGKWHHWAVVYDGRTAANVPSLYIDGVSQTVTTTGAASGSFSGMGTSAMTTYANNSALSSPLAGSLAHFCMYKKMLLTGADIALLYARGPLALGVPPEIYYPFDDSLPGGLLLSLAAHQVNVQLDGTSVFGPMDPSDPYHGQYVGSRRYRRFAPVLYRPQAGLNNYTLTADYGSYALTGQDAGLLRGLVIVAEHGTYTLSGQDATLLVARLLVAAEGAYTLSGQAALLLAARLLTADHGVYTLSGQDADLIYSGGNPTLTADVGLYTLSGQDALLLASRLLTADHGSYALTGQDALLLASRLLTAEHATYTLSGQAASLLASRGLVAEAGTYTVSGQDALLLASRILTASHGSYVLTGQDATLTAAPAVLPAAILVVDSSGRRLLTIDVSARRLVLDVDDSARRVIVLAQPLLPQ